MKALGSGNAGKRLEVSFLQYEASHRFIYRLLRAAVGKFVGSSAASSNVQGAGIFTVDRPTKQTHACTGFPAVQSRPG
jgi:hypothetical protein